MACMWFVFISLSIFVCACTVTADVPNQTCPPPEDIYPCICTRIYPEYPLNNLVCEGVREISVLEGVLNRARDYAFDSFVLRDSSMMYLPVGLFEIKRLNKIRIFDTTFINLFDEKRSNVSSLERFELTNVKLGRGMNWEIFAPLENLYFLEFKNVVGLKIDQEFTKYVPRNLTYLYIRNSNLKKLDDESFASLEKLLYLTVENTKIRQVKRSMFPAGLKRLALNHNRIKVLPEDIFNGMDDLEYAWFDSNLITTLPKEAFLEIPQLKKFYGSGNPLKCDCGIKWTIETRTVFDGECNEPPYLKGRDLFGLKKDDFPQCE